MTATGLDVFDKTIQTTNIWLDEIMAEIGPDRQVAWHVLGVTLRALRDRIPTELGAHLSSQLPLLVRGAFYDQWKVLPEPLKIRSQDEYIQFVRDGLAGIRAVDPRAAVIALFNVLSRHVPRGQAEKVRDALPKDLQVLWNIDAAADQPSEGMAESGRRAEASRDARIYESRPDGQRKRA